VASFAADFHVVVARDRQHGQVGDPTVVDWRAEPKMWMMLSCRQSARMRIMKGALVAALVLLFFGDFRLNSVMGQVKGPAPVFKPALEQIRSQTRIPILLPSRLPSVIPERDIKLAVGKALDGGYFISLYFSEIGVDANFSAGFGGSTSILHLQDLPNTHRVALSGGRAGMFRPVSCGGSCAPANLWWEQNGAMYQIQIKLRADSPEEDQEKILVQTANSTVTARRD
jgi:hypothetical protein